MTEIISRVCEDLLGSTHVNKLAIGTHLRRIRTGQSRTIREIADKCSLSKSLISKIETDKGFH